MANACKSKEGSFTRLKLIEKHSQIPLNNARSIQLMSQMADFSENLENLINNEVHLRDYSFHLETYKLLVSTLEEMTGFQPAAFAQ